MPKAKAVTARALELDDTVAEAHISLGRINFYFDWAWDGAEMSFRRAIELNPNLAYAHCVYALLLSALRRHTEAIREAKLSQELDPVSLLNNFTLGIAYTHARQVAAGEEQYRRTLELDPNFGVARWMLGAVLLFMGRYDDGIGELEKAVAIAPNIALPRGLLGWAYAKADRGDKALRVLNELTDLTKLRYVTPMAWVFTYIGMGDERVFEALEEAYQQRSPSLVWANVSGVFDELHGDARYQDMLRRM